MLGQLGWYVPKFTALRDPTVLTYFGLSGQENREKLANLFLRPTRWGDYYDDVSNATRLSDDGVVVFSSRIIFPSLTHPTIVFD